MSVTTGRWARAGRAAATARTRLVRTARPSRSRRAGCGGKALTRLPCSTDGSSPGQRLGGEPVVWTTSRQPARGAHLGLRAQELVREPARWAQQAASRRAAGSAGRTWSRPRRRHAEREERHVVAGLTLQAGVAGTVHAADARDGARRDRGWPRRDRRGAGRPAAGGWRCCAPAARGRGRPTMVIRAAPASRAARTQSSSRSRPWRGSTARIGTPRPARRCWRLGGQGVEVADDEVGNDAGRQATRGTAVRRQHERPRLRVRGGRAGRGGHHQGGELGSVHVAVADDEDVGMAAASRTSTSVAAGTEAAL